MMPTPTITNRTPRRLSGLTGKGRATVALLAIRDHWELLTPAQRRAVDELLGRLSVAMRREHSLANRAPSPVLVPLVGRLSA